MFDDEGKIRRETGMFLARTLKCLSRIMYYALLKGNPPKSFTARSQNTSDNCNEYITIIIIIIAITQ